MARSLVSSRFLPIGALAALTALGSLAASTGASAGCPSCGAAHAVGQMQFMMGAAALGGMAVGAVAANAASGGAGYGGCYIVRRQAVDEFGDVYVRRVRVCQ